MELALEVLKLPSELSVRLLSDAVGRALSDPCTVDSETRMAHRTIISTNALIFKKIEKNY